MADNPYQIRVMTRDELDMALDWATQEGWNPGLRDAELYYQADPQGFLIGLLNDRPVACISAMRYNDHYGFMGFYIVHPQYRGQGYGLAIWQAAMDYLQGVTIGLDGVVAQQSNYCKSGFAPVYRHVRYAGQGGAQVDNNPMLVTLSQVPWEALLAYEQRFFPAPRPAFLRAWIQQPESHALGYWEAGHLHGYGVIRRCQRGYKIGPLQADNPALAEALFQALSAQVAPDEPIYLDVPEANPEAVALAQRHGLEVVFETARMYRGAVPELPLAQIFGVTSFEIG